MKKNNLGGFKVIFVLILLMIGGYEYYKTGDTSFLETYFGDYLDFENSNDYTTSSTGSLGDITDNIDDKSYSKDDIPKYSGSPWVILNNNNPSFEKKDISTVSFEKYSQLDSLGRCGSAYANVSIETMPTEPRGSIGSVKPTGWQTVQYDIVDGKYLYNRCHLIGFQLTGENANRKNLITCTRYMNTVGMLEFENKIANYVKETNNHVLYRVTPIFDNNNLVANGVIMEGLSVEDNGKGIKFNVFVYNVQKGIKINYATGESRLG